MLREVKRAGGQMSGADRGIAHWRDCTQLSMLLIELGNSHTTESALWCRAKLDYCQTAFVQGGVAS
jgi:hypothetical protein